MKELKGSQIPFKLLILNNITRFIISAKEIEVSKRAERFF